MATREQRHADALARRRWLASDGSLWTVVGGLTIDAEGRSALLCQGPGPFRGYRVIPVVDLRTEPPEPDPAPEPTEIPREVNGLVVLRSCSMCSECMPHDHDKGLATCGLDPAPEEVERVLSPAQAPPSWCPWRGSPT